MRGWQWISGLLAACTDPSAPLRDDSGALPADGPRPEDVMATLQRTLDTLDGLHALPMIEAYEALAPTMRDSCPSPFVDHGTVHWSGHCTTPEGVVWSGAAFWYDFAVIEPPPERWEVFAAWIPETGRRSGREVFGQIDIRDPEAGALRFSGSAGVLAVVSGDRRVEISRVEGEGEFSGEDVDSWIVGAPRPELRLVRIWERDRVEELVVRGAIGGLEGPVTALRVNMSVGREATGLKCKVRGFAAGRSDEGAWTWLKIEGYVGNSCTLTTHAAGGTFMSAELDDLAATEPWPW